MDINWRQADLKYIRDAGVLGMGFCTCLYLRTGSNVTLLTFPQLPKERPSGGSPGPGAGAPACSGVRGALGWPCVHTNGSTCCSSVSFGRRHSPWGWDRDGSPLRVTQAT